MPASHVSRRSILALAIACQGLLSYRRHQMTKRILCVGMVLFLVQARAAGQTQPKPELVAQAGHAQGVWSVAVSSDGAWLLTGGFDGIAVLWELASGDELRVFKAGTKVWTVAFSEDQRIALTDGRAFDLSTGRSRPLLQGRPAGSRGYLTRSGKFWLEQDQGRVKNPGPRPGALKR